MNQPLLRHITNLLAGIAAAVVVAVGLWSCSGEDPAEVADEDGTVAFRVVTHKAVGGRASRAITWGDKYEALGGIDFETAILKDQLQAVITDGTCQQHYAVTGLFCTKVTEHAVSITYEYTGRISKEDREKLREVTDGKFHIIANAGTGATLDDNTQFILSGRPSDQFNAIPMWGVMSVDFSKLVPDGLLNIGDIYLLRSMAKVVIERDNDDADNYISNISEVTVSTINSDGYLLPADWSEIVKTKNLDRHSPRVPMQQTAAGPVTFTIKDNYVEFYLPEIINGTGDDEVTLTIEFDTELGPRTGTLYFRKYDNGEPGDTPLDVLRNYLYHYTVKMLSNSEVVIIADVKPYTSVELEPGFGILPNANN